MGIYKKASGGHTTSIGLANIASGTYAVALGELNTKNWHKHHG